MSDIFKTKEIRYIDDCRMLNYAECIGLLTHGIIFNKTCSTDYLYRSDEFKSDFLFNINQYTMQCDPEQKTIIITIYCKNNYNYQIHFIPLNERGIKINIINIDKNKIGFIEYSIEELEDILL